MSGQPRETPNERSGHLLEALAELCREHRIDEALAERSRDLDELIDLVIAEYERRPPHDLRSLCAFTRQAAILEERAAAARRPADHDELFERLGTLAHRINNPLTSLVGRAQILGLKKGIDPQIDKAAAVIEESGKRIASLVRELADIVREGREAAR
jgi:signal transduction histidine kinase